MLLHSKNALFVRNRNLHWVEVFEFFRHFIDLVFGDEQRFFIDGNHTFTHSLAIQVKLLASLGRLKSTAERNIPANLISKI